MHTLGFDFSVLAPAALNLVQMNMQLKAQKAAAKAQLQRQRAELAMARRQEEAEARRAKSSVTPKHLIGLAVVGIGAVVLIGALRRD